MDALVDGRLVEENSVNLGDGEKLKQAGNKQMLAFDCLHLILLPTIDKL
jgi:hypothetical protein